MEQSFLLMKEKYDLEFALSCLERELAEKKAQINYALYESREAKIRELEYRGSMKSLLHGFAGKREEEKERLARETRAAEAKLEAEKRALAALELRLQQTKERLEQIPEVVPNDDPQWQKGAAGIRAKHLLRITLPLPDAGVSALELARDWTQPKLHLDGTNRTRFGCQEAANDLAKEIRRNVEELNECLAVLGKEPIELGPYFYGPEAYLVTAFQYGTLDQMNKAMDQVLDCRRALNDLQNRLE